MNKRSIGFRLVDALLILMMILPLVGAMALQVLTKPASDGVAIAGARIFFFLQAIKVVVSISSAMPFAIFPITFALAGAIINTSASSASAICSTLNLKLRSKVSTMHLLPVRLSKVIGFIKFVAFCVIITFTSA